MDVDLEVPGRDTHDLKVLNIDLEVLDTHDFDDFDVEHEILDIDLEVWDIDLAVLETFDLAEILVINLQVPKSRDLGIFLYRPWGFGYWSWDFRMSKLSNF